MLRVVHLACAAVASCGLIVALAGSCGIERGGLNPNLDAPPNGQPRGVTCGAVTCELDEICCGTECAAAGCDDGNDCTDDSCGEQGCVNEPRSGSCDDGIYCNGEDTCERGQCLLHVGDPCRNQTTCDENSDQCVGCLTSADCLPTTRDAEACEAPAGDICATTGTQEVTITEYTCDNQVCVRTRRDDTQSCSLDTDGIACDDDDACTESDACSDGVCTGSAVDCSVSNPCKVGICNSDTGCGEVNALDGTSCSDGDNCTESDVCTAGSCGGSPKICADTGNACTVNTCNPSNGACEVQNTGGSCDDGNQCTHSDSCGGGSCSGTPFSNSASEPCDDGNASTCDDVCRRIGSFAFCQGSASDC